jgi:hypothetical protein
LKIARLGPLSGAGSFLSGQIINSELMHNPENWVMYTRMLDWNYLVKKLHENDANSRCDHVDFVL